MKGKISMQSLEEIRCKEETDDFGERLETVSHVDFIDRSLVILNSFSDSRAEIVYYCYDYHLQDQGKWYCIKDKSAVDADVALQWLSKKFSDICLHQKL
jgi:hypothetical protein